MSEWKENKLGDLLLEKPRNGIYKGSSFLGRGNSYIKMSDLYSLDFINDKSTSELIEATRVEIDRFGCKEGDLLFGRTSLTFEGVGKCSLITKCHNEIIFESNIFRIRPDRSKASSLYLYYFFKSKIGRDYLKSISSQTAATSIRSSEMVDLILSLPELNTQTAIAEILSSIDDKIELNNKINRELENLAQTLFKQWFIDFEFPNESGEPYKSSGGEMAESELGMIPKGWEAVRLSTLLTVKYGKDHKHLNDGIYPLYGSGGIMRYVEKPLYQYSSILIPRKGTLSNLFYLEEPFWSVDTMFYTEIHNPIYGKYLFHCIKELDIASMNVGSAVPSMTTKVLNELIVLNPNNTILSKFDEVVSAFYETLNFNNQEVKELTNLRDTLLPKIISGELEINKLPN